MSLYRKIITVDSIPNSTGKKITIDNSSIALFKKDGKIYAIQNRCHHQGADLADGFVKDGGRVLGICGGYQLLGERIRDPSGVESDRKEVKGLSLLPVETILEKEKVVRKVIGTCLINGKRTVLDLVNAFEERYRVNRREAELSVVSFMKMLMQKKIILVRGVPQ